MKMRIVLGLIGFIGAGVLLSWTGKEEAVKVASTDQFNVIKVDGRIIFQKTKTDMKRGDVYVTGTPLHFTTVQSRAAVVSNQKGRFVLSGAEKGQTKILPAANNISSRAGALINMVDLKNHFTGKYLVIDKLALELNGESFPQNDESFFYLTYEQEGETEVIRKKLSHEGDKLIIDKSEIFMIDGKEIPVEEKEMTLYYRTDGTSAKINTFTPVFPNKTELKEEIEIILSEYSEADSDTKLKEVTAYLTEFYGKPNKENVAEWLKAEFGI